MTGESFNLIASYYSVDSVCLMIVLIVLMAFGLDTYINREGIGHNICIVKVSIYI